MSASVLHFWRDVEIFTVHEPPNASEALGNPKSSTQTTVTALLSPDDSEKFPWLQKLPEDCNSVAHTVYLGVLDQEELYEGMLATLCPGQPFTEVDREQIGAKGFLAAVTVDQQGYPLAKTFKMPDYALALEQFRRTGRLDGLYEASCKAKEEFAERWHAIAPEDAGILEDLSRGYSFTPERLGDEIHRLQAMYGCPSSPPRLVISSEYQKKPTDKTRLDALEKEARPPFFSSYFLNDLDRLVEQADCGHAFGKALTRYLAPDVDSAARQDVLKDSSGMRDSLNPASLPASRWPASSAHSLMPAQQAAVAEILRLAGSDQALLAVNGPPGTGKTTLLCDVIAEIVSLRATRIAALGKPGDIFQIEDCMINGYPFYPLRAELMQDSQIIVSSSNNNAVENISRDIPKREKIAAEEFSATYFTEPARAVFTALGIEDEPWGLVAATLGKSKNCYDFGKYFFYGLKTKHETIPGMQVLLKNEDTAEATKHWYTVRDDFLQISAEIEHIKAAFTQIFATLEQQAALKNSVLQLHQERARAMQALEHCDQQAEALARKALEAQEQAQQAEAPVRVLLTRRDELDMQIQLLEQELKDLRSRAPKYGLKAKFLLFWGKASPEQQHEHACWDAACAALDARLALNTQERFSVSQILPDTVQNLDKAFDAVSRINREKETLASERSVHEQTHIRVQAEVLALEKKLAAPQSSTAYDFNIPDDAFFQQGDSWHLKPVWVDEKLEHLRAERFLAALRLHEWTIRACAPQFLQNMRTFVPFLQKPTQYSLKSTEIQRLWDAFFFIVPVVSTTLAAFSRLFKGLGQESLGWLLLDEAGQATPQSAAGALWRARKVVIIGDPLQIEPIVPVPASVIQHLRTRHGVSAEWTPGPQSTQTLADRVARKGTWVGGTNRTWTGMPLRAHRRCIDPMFRISNAIAYDGQMVQAISETPAFECILGESAWLHVEGRSADEQCIPEELDCLQQQLQRLHANWPHNAGHVATVYVISPFKRVAEECDKVIRDCAAIAQKKDHKVQCGTIHRFQGKEADIVLLVLGSKPGIAGSGSRLWVSQSPNILNVALTRAKQRVYVIGNYHDWSQCTFFQYMAQELPKQTL